MPYRNEAEGNVTPSRSTWVHRVIALLAEYVMLCVVLGWMTGVTALTITANLYPLGLTLATAPALLFGVIILGVFGCAVAASRRTRHVGSSAARLRVAWDRACALGRESEPWCLVELWVEFNGESTVSEST
jgi:hypothetical protein